MRRAETNHQAGLNAEQAVVSLLEQEGWRILARRLRMPGGEIDLVATRDDVVVFGEVKRRATLDAAAFALRPRQQSRLIDAAESALAIHPEWRMDLIRFDVFVMDRLGHIQRIEDAIRQ